MQIDSQTHSRAHGQLHALTVGELAAAPGPVDLVPIKYDLVINTRPEVLLEQTRHNLARGLPELTDNLTRPWGRRTASLCGSGPSLMQNLARLRGRAWGKVMAVNAAIPALHRAGVRVDYAMIWDATPEMVRYACAISGCQWMIASRVHPCVIDRLLELGQDVTLWTTGTTERAMIELTMGHLWVFGGRTGATRGPFLLGAMGYRDLHIFGADSSYSADTHVGGSLRREEEVVCSFEGEAYRTTIWMIDQAESWVKFVLPELVPTGMRFTVHGDGLLPAAHRSWERQVLPTWPWHKRLAWRASPWW